MAEKGTRMVYTLFLLVFVFGGNWRSFASAQAPAESEGQCVMYGQCGEGDYGSLNCVYNGPPKPVQDENALNILKNICPEFVQDGQAVTCCDPLQLEAMESNFKLPARLLNRCPSCFANFRKNFCRLTCSPVQSKYLQVTETQKNDEGKDMISQLTYFMAERFANGLFESCQNVEGIIPGTRVIEMMCGSWSKKCTGPKWLQFMGSTPENQGFSPFQINYTLVKDSQIEEGGVTYYPMDDPVVKCSEAPTLNDKICSCGDCQASCSRPATEATTTSTTTTTTTVAPTTSTAATATSSSAGTTITDINSITSSAAASSDANSSSSTLPVITKTSVSTTDSLTTADESRGENVSSGASTLGTKINNKLFRRILSPLIVIAPAFADN